MKLDYNSLEEITRTTEELELLEGQLKGIQYLFDQLIDCTDHVSKIPIVINGDDSFEGPFGFTQFFVGDIEDSAEAYFSLDVTTTIKILGASREALLKDRAALLSELEGLGFNINNIKKFKHDIKH